ncbi:hypothetical protein XENOCAPTIV_001527, partial [Xenoophorus captivus]
MEVFNLRAGSDLQTVLQFHSGNSWSVMDGWMELEMTYCSRLQHGGLLLGSTKLLCLHTEGSLHAGHMKPALEVFGCDTL